MILNEYENKRLNTLARGRHGQLLLKILEEIKNEVADVRTPLKVQPEFEKDVRLAVVEIIEDRLINLIKKHSGELVEHEENWE